jgi:Trk K+ transport system NAD-binding subunit
MTEPTVFADPSTAPFESCREWRGHVIVCGMQDVALRAVRQLQLAGARVVVVTDRHADERLLRSLHGHDVPTVARTAYLSDSLAEAGIAGAVAVICVDASDLQTLETVLLVRDLRPDIRIVAQLDNPAVARAVEEASGSAAVIDVAALFSPPVIEACLRRRAHDIDVEGVHFVALETVVTRDATLRELFGSLVPLGVVTDAQPEPIVCPGRDEPVGAGDRVTLLGTHEELAAAGLEPHSAVRAEVQAVGARALSRARRLVAQVMSADRSLRVALELGVLLLVVSTLVLHFFYQRPGGLPLVSAVYFTVETIATVGFGDFSFATQPLYMELFGITLIVAGTTLVTTLFALLTNALVSHRIAQSLGQARIPGMRDHVVLIGLGSVGMTVLDGLLARGREVVVVERDESNRFLNQVRQRHVPLIVGDSTLAQTLDAVNLVTASSVAIVTSDDLTNIETGLAVRDRLGARWADVPVVLRVFDRELGARLERSFGFRQVWSTAAIAAPWFVGAALGLDVLSSFYVGSHPFLLARLTVADGGGLEGVAMRELGAAIRVIAISRAGADVRLEHPPRRGTTLAAGDDAYLAGPYEELLSILRRERERPSGRADSTSA